MSHGQHTSKGAGSKRSILELNGIGRGSSWMDAGLELKGMGR